MSLARRSSTGAVITPECSAGAPQPLGFVAMRDGVIAAAAPEAARRGRAGARPRLRRGLVMAGIVDAHIHPIMGRSRPAASTSRAPRRGSPCAAALAGDIATPTTRGSSAGASTRSPSAPPSPIETSSTASTTPRRSVRIFDAHSALASRDGDPHSGHHGRGDLTEPRGSRVDARPAHRVAGGDDARRSPGRTCPRSPSTTGGGRARSSAAWPSPAWSPARCSTSAPDSLELLEGSNAAGRPHPAAISPLVQPGFADGDLAACRAAGTAGRAGTSGASSS